MKTFKCLEEIQKKDVLDMEFDDLRVMVAEVNKEAETERMKKFLLDILDVRDAGINPRIIDFTKDRV